MSYRRLAATAAVFAAGVALISGPAYAADPAGAPHGAKPAGTPPISTDLPGGKTYTSPASKAVRAQRAATAAPGELKSRATPTGKTIFASSYCYNGTGGDGTEANPYCRPQDAVDAAAPGDTVKILGSQGYFSWTPITVRTSGISLVGVGIQAWIQPTNADSGKPALVLDGVSDVTVSNLMLSAWGTNAVQIKGSSNITLDSSYVGTQGGHDALLIDGTSHDVTVSRTFVDTGNASLTASGILVESGAKSVTLAGNILAATGIKATDVTGLNVTGNTVQRNCMPALAVGGTSTGVSVENNFFEDANATTDYYLGGYKAVCPQTDTGWAPDVTVSEGSAAGTASDYNSFHVDGDNATVAYDWAGTAYATPAAFAAAVAGQGAHDLVDPKKPNNWGARPNISASADSLLQQGSVSIGSANAAAPGALTTDFYGAGPHTSRGAAEPSNPALALGLSSKQTSAHGVTLSAAVKTGGLPTTLRVDWGDGGAEWPTVSGDGTINVKHRYEQLGSYTMTVTLTDSKGNSSVNTLKVTTAGSDYTPYGPTRLLDTRSGLGAAKQKVGSYGTVRLKVGGNGGIPANASAVVLNLTATNPTQNGFLTAYPEGDQRPFTSNVNYTAGQTVPNQVVVPVGDGGYVDVYSGSAGTVDVIADVAGYFTQSASSEYTPIDPARLVDTRQGLGTGKGKLSGGNSFATQVSGLSTSNAYLPSGITAVALNVTVTGGTNVGFLTAYPDGQQTPVASNLNYSTNQTIANSVIVPVGSDGKIRFYNGSYGSADVVVDIVGYYSAGGRSAYLPLTPERLLDTRDASWKYGQLDNGEYIYMPLAANEPDITGFVLNTTVTRTTGVGFLTVSPDPNSLSQYQNNYASWPTRPLVSSLNWTKGQTVPNLVQASTGYNGILDFWNSGTGKMDLVVDIFGYYQNS
ncbi:right-handed parallel beta-helix repeat-containing protein [Kitasatospora sp. NPDC059571]|uniref:right-handed parallel beta-helix repeat-containing protein n=1 Tax=Kitasatospora sp. NPDC059571 TaxID=3346871 RepID=UPI0036C8C88E